MRFIVNRHRMATATAILFTLALGLVLLGGAPSRQAHANERPCGPHPMVRPPTRVPEHSPTQWGGTSSPTTHEKFATFLAGDGFGASLLLENVRPDESITARPSLILDEGEIPLAPVTLPAHSSTTVDLSAFLQSHGYTDKRGTVSVRFDFPSYGPLIAVAQSIDQSHYIYLNSYAQSPEEYWAGTAYDGVVWAPDAGTKGFISITNAAKESRTVHVTTVVNGHPEPLPAIDIPSRSTKALPIDGLVARSRANGAGIHVEFDEYPGDILVEGQVFNDKTGFAKYLHFVNKALQYPTATLRTHFLLLGAQPAEEGFPMGMSFRSVAAVRNIDAAPVNVTPTVKFLKDASLQTINLPSLALRGGESGTIDFTAAQNSGQLPSDLHQASLELVPDNSHANMVAELFNFSAQSGGYVVGPTFTSYPNHGSSSIWRTDGSFQTIVTVENTASRDDEITLKLFSDWSTYSKVIPIPAEGLIKISVKELEEHAVPDKDGKVLAGTYGILSVVGRDSRSKLAFDKLIYSSSESDYVGLPPNPCDYVTGIGLYLDTSGGQNPSPMIATWNWAQSGAQNQAASGTSSSNTSVAQISNNGSGDMVTLSPPDDGQTYQVSFSAPPVTTTDCDACSSGQIYVAGITSGLRIAHTYWGPPVTVKNGLCYWGTIVCTAPTKASCTSGIGVVFASGCPTYILAKQIVYNGQCYSPSEIVAASGPGPCD